MTDHAKRYAITTPDGYTVRATTCRAIIECMDPEGGVQITGALLPVGGSLTYAHLASTATLSPDGLRAVADVLLGVASDTAQDAAGCPQIDQQPEPGQVDGYEETGPAKPRSTMLHLAEVDWQEYYETTQTMNGLLARAEKAEAELSRSRDIQCKLVGERDQAVEWLRAAEAAHSKAEAERDAILDDLRHLEAQWDNTPDRRQLGAFVRTAIQLGDVIDRHTPEG